MRQNVFCAQFAFFLSLIYAIQSFALPSSVARPFFQPFFFSFCLYSNISFTFVLIRFSFFLWILLFSASLPVISLIFNFIPLVTIHAFPSFGCPSARQSNRDYCFRFPFKFRSLHCTILFPSFWFSFISQEFFWFFYSVLSFWHLFVPEVERFFFFFLTFKK